MGEMEGREDLGSQLDIIMKAAAEGNATEKPYERGAAVLWALQHQMGNKAFFSLMHELFVRYHEKEITTQDFLSLVAEYGDYPVEQWLYDPIEQTGLALYQS
jgi:aminopeptidase N